MKHLQAMLYIGDKRESCIPFHLERWMKLSFVMGMLMLLFSCRDDDLSGGYYTFTGETIGSYIEDRPERFSEFYALLDTTEVIGLLRAYGKYTCYIPDNDAMHAFYKKSGKERLSDFEMEDLTKLAYHHIIKGYEITTVLFVDGFQSNLTMSGRYLKIEFESDAVGGSYVINSESKVEDKDIELHNGIAHVLDAVLSPTENTLLEAIEKDAKFSLFYEALLYTGLDEMIKPVKDDSYAPPADLLAEFGDYDDGNYFHRVPRERKYGFTALMESNRTYATLGLDTTNLSDLEAYAKAIYDPVFPNDADVTDVKDRRNSLNRYIAYHLIDKKLPKQFFIDKYDNTGRKEGTSHSVKRYDMFEYIETMCPNTLLEVRTNRTSGETNLFNMINATGEVIRLTENYDNDAINGVYHEIDGVLAYNSLFVGELSGKRLRINPACFFPEFTNNSVRVGHANPEYNSEKWHFPRGYIDRVSTSETTELGYFNSDDRFLNFQGDEVFLSGMYDFEIETLPIPAGTYEVRFGYKANGSRGAAQLYWDGQPSGIPLDLTISATNPKIGYVRPGTDPSDINGYENDKMMRNRGYMKGGASYQSIGEDAYDVGTGRSNAAPLRRILGIFTFSEAGTHIFGVKAAREGEFMFDFLEFVPLELIESEGIE